MMNIIFINYIINLDYYTYLHNIYYIIIIFKDIKNIKIMFKFLVLNLINKLYKDIIHKFYNFY